MKGIKDVSLFRLNNISFVEKLTSTGTYFTR